MRVYLAPNRRFYPVSDRAYRCAPVASQYCAPWPLWPRWLRCASLGACRSWHTDRLGPHWKLFAVKQGAVIFSLLFHFWVGRWHFSLFIDQLETCTFCGTKALIYLHTVWFTTTNLLVRHFYWFLNSFKSARLSSRSLSQVFVIFYSPGTQIFWLIFLYFIAPGFRKSANQDNLAMLTSSDCCTDNSFVPRLYSTLKARAIDVDKLYVGNMSS